MANNPYVNKVEYGGQTLIDLTADTVTPSDVLKGVTFHDRSGALQTGSGGEARNQVIFFDTAFSSTVYHGYDAEILDKVSGKFRASLTAKTEMTFTFKKAGRVRFGAEVANSSVTILELNGTSVLNQDVNVNVGDTFYVNVSYYNYPVVILEPDITQS